MKPTPKQLGLEINRAIESIEYQLSELEPNRENPSVRSMADELEGELNGLRAILAYLAGNPVYLNIISRGIKD